MSKTKYSLSRVSQKIKICYLVSNDINHDPRVKKQIKSSARAGFNVLALGYGYLDLTQQIEDKQNEKNTLIIKGIYNNPYQTPKTLKFIIRFFRLAIFIILHPAKVFNRLRLIAIYFKNKLFFQVRLLLMKRFPKFYNFLIKNLPKTFLQKIRQSSINGKQFQINPQDSSRASQTTKKNSDIKTMAKENYFRAKINNFFKKNLIFIFNFSFYWEMNKFFAKHGIEYCPDIVHANDLDTLLAGYWIKKKTGAKLIYDAHEIWVKQGLLLPPMILLIFAMIEKFLLRKIDIFISVNESIIKEISHMYHYRFTIPTLAIYNCPAYQKINFKSRKKPEIKILYQGRYCFDRGLEELTKSAKYLSNNATIYFRAMGDPLTKERLEKIVDKYNLSQKVKFLKPVSMDRMVEAAKDFDIGVISYIPVNINNRLCTPNKLFEYIGAGLALAVSDLPELKKVVKEYNNGLPFNPRSPRSIAKTLNKLIKNRDQLDQMRKNSLQAAKKYNWENEEKKLTQLYEQLFDQSRK